MEIPRYEYRAINIEGQEIRGTLESENKKEVVGMLRKRGFYPLEIKVVREPKDLRGFQIFPKITSRDLSIFCRQYGAILKAGVPSVQGLYILIDQTGNPCLKETLQRVYYLLQGGHSLSQAMLKQGNKFPLILIRTIESGEWSGTLDTSFEKIADYFERQHKLKQKTRRALAYPILLVITSIIIVYLLLKIVVPQFVNFFEDSQVQLPYCTRVLLGLNDFIANWTFLLLILPFAIYALFKVLLSHKTCRLYFHGLLLRIPYLGSLIKKIISARFNRTMAILLSSGVPITQALAISSKVTENEFIKSRLTQGADMVQQGMGLARSLNILEVFSPDIISVMAIGEESGQVEKMMNRIADICELEAEGAVDRFISLLEPISILILGGIIAFIVISVALPMFDMYVFLD